MGHCLRNHYYEFKQECNIYYDLAVSDAVSSNLNCVDDQTNPRSELLVIPCLVVLGYNPIRTKPRGQNPTM